MLELNAKTTALVVIDLPRRHLTFCRRSTYCRGLLIVPGSWRRNFRASGQPVFLVRVGWFADYAEDKNRLVDALPAKVLLRKTVAISCRISATYSDIEIIKRQRG